MISSILIDATHYQSPFPTGIETYVRFLLPGLSERLIEKGVRVSWVGHTPNPPACLPASVFWIYSAHKPFWSQAALPKLLAALAPDLFFTPSGISPLLYKGKTVLTVHDMAVYRVPGSFSAGQRFRLGALESRAAKRAALILTPSNYSKNQIQYFWKIDAQKIAVTPLAYQAEKTEEEALPGQPTFPYFLFVGRLEAKKNLEPVLKAFVRLAAERTCGLVLAGRRGFGSGRLDRALKALPPEIAGRILEPGYISEGQKSWLYANAAAVVVPSMVEGFGIPVLEAFAQGSPVICAQAGSLPEVAAEAALYAQGDIPTDWYLQMKALLDDRSLADQCRSRGSKRLADFSWRQTVEQTAEAILRL